MRAGSLTVTLIACLFTSPVWAEFESTSLEPPPGTADADQRPWDVSVRAFFGHTDNVQVVPDSTFFTGTSDDEYVGYAVRGVYRPIQNEDLTVGLTGNVSQLFYLDNATGGGARRTTMTWR